MNQYSFSIDATSVMPEKYVFTDEQEDALHFLQTANWYNSRSGDYIVAGTFENGKIVARSIIKVKNLPLQIGKVYKVERGPVATKSKVLHTHIGQLCHNLKNDGIIIEISPYSESDTEICKINSYLLAHGWKCIQETRNFYKNTIVVDLDPSIDEIRRAFRKSLKNCLNRANRLGMKCEIDPDQEKVEALIKQYNVMAKKRALKPISDQDKNYIFGELSGGKVIVCIISLDEVQLGGNIMFSYKHKLAAEWGVYSDKKEHKKIPMSHFADWEAIKWAKDHGYRTYDLCGYWLDEGSNNPINMYKRGFSKKIMSIMPEYDYHLKPFIARSINTARKFYSKIN